MHENAFQRAAGLIRDADALVVAAGAGMGIDSGLPDFRGAKGFWTAYPALGRRGISFHEVASPRTFTTDPTLAWGFYGHRLALYRQTVPHRGFGILHRWGEHMPQGCRVFTSNVDGQFQRAGFSESTLTECHGSIHHLQCSHPCCNDTWPADEFIPEVDEATCSLLNEPPKCPRCDRIARPNIMMFGDSEWIEYRSRRQDTEMRHWLSTTNRTVVIELGAGTVIPSVRHFSHDLIVNQHARLIRINPRESAVAARDDVSIASPALRALEIIETLLVS